MPTQPLHHVSTRESQNPDSLPHLVIPAKAGIQKFQTNNPNIRNKPNLPHRRWSDPNSGTGTACRAPATQKQTQFTVPPASRRLFQAQKRKTNPICPHGHPNYTKRTQFPCTAGVSPAFPAPIMQNEPNLSPTAIFPPSNYAKRTQFPHTNSPAAPYFSQTNPISTAPDLWKTKKTKRTQFPVPLASRRLF